MSDYNLSGLSTRSFEKLIQSIAGKVLGLAQARLVTVPTEAERPPLRGGWTTLRQPTGERGTASFRRSFCNGLETQAPTAAGP